MAQGDFGERLRGLRRAARLTQQELAERAGLTREGIAQLETGRRSPAWAPVEALCRALQVGPAAFTSAGDEGAGRVRSETANDTAFNTTTRTDVPVALNLLLVEDDDNIALLMRRSLERAAHQVTRCRTAGEARAVLAAQRFDLILLDHRLPDVEGLDLLRQLSAGGAAPPVVLVTGCGSENLAVSALHAGALDYIAKDPVIAFLNELPGRVADAVRRSLERERLAAQDPLTGLLNRRAVDELVRTELERRGRYPSPLALAVLDLDHFKRINLEYLLTGGDEVLRRLAQVMAATVREVDSLGRFGGDEFLLLARETGMEGAAALAERIRAAVASTPVEYHRQEIHATISVGFAVAEAGVPADYDGMLREADNAVEEAKRSGRNRCVVRAIEAPRLTR
jgi:diguanylate cyclase (GGDEF)-like protein